MASTTGTRGYEVIEPQSAWTIVTDAPLRGLAAARESGRVLVWDESDGLTLLDLNGETCSAAKAPAKIAHASISDDGSLIALVLAGPRLLLLSADLEPLEDRAAPPEPLAVAIDPHGRFLAVSSAVGPTYLYNKYAKAAGMFQTRQALAHLHFVAGRPMLVGAAAHGTLSGIELEHAGSGKIEPVVVWQVSLLSNVGRLSADGDGGMILASCYTHGLQRYDRGGHNEGSYHLGGSVAHAASDFAGRMIAAATLEGELALLNRAGNILWRDNLPRPAKALETDPLGRYLIIGTAGGEVTRINLFGGPRAEFDIDHRGVDPSRIAPVEPRRSRANGQTSRSGSVGESAEDALVLTPAGRAGSTPRSVRKPAWSIPFATTDDEAETTILGVLDDPPRVALVSRRNQLRVFQTDGVELGAAPEMIGVGRVVRTAPGWIATATDRMIVICDVRRSAAQRLDLSLVELTHFAIRPDTFGLFLVQERDRISRTTATGRVIWKSELRDAVEEIAIGPEGHCAYTDQEGRLVALDPAGAECGGYREPGGEPLLLIDAPESAPRGVAWVTLARRAQVLCGHNLQGKPLWRATLPWEGWRLERAGPWALANAADGRAVACDGTGRIQHRDDRIGQPEALNDPFGIDAQDNPWRITRQGMHLLCTDFEGRVRWRAVVEGAIGPLAVGRIGVAAVLGRSLAFFPEVTPDIVPTL